MLFYLIGSSAGSTVGVGSVVSGGSTSSGGVGSVSDDHADPSSSKNDLENQEDTNRKNDFYSRWMLSGGHAAKQGE